MSKTIFFPIVLSLLLAWFSGAGGADLSKFDQPLLITSSGQSAEVQLASVLAKRAGLDASVVKTAGPSDLQGRKTLVLVLGASLKGLGAAGIDAAQEKERVKLLITAAQNQNIPILCMHLGGEARRGQLTDQLIEEFLPSGQMAIIVKSGNKDGIFSIICTKHNIPLVEVDRTADALTPFKNAFN
ncbi:MAG: hypothetical protein JXB23_17900 [Candidatus Aminicenantes bacterium]|nr:hypothetical protein [Candidatus Aminicenantes bacterium]